MATIADLSSKKFRYQHRVSIALAYACGHDSTLLIEQGEDAQLSCTRGSSPKRVRVDLQVKDQLVTVDESSLAGILAHFQPHSVDRCAVDILREDEQRLFIVATSARCTDSLNSLTTRVDLMPPSARVENPLSGGACQPLLEAFENIWKDSKNRYAGPRASHCGSLSKQLGKRGLQKILRRVFIIDRLDGDAVDAMIQRSFGTHHRVSASRFNDSLNHVLQRIEDLLPHDGDVIPLIASWLRPYQADAILAPDKLHLSGAHEGSLELILRRGRILLLTGPSLCGKTRIAQAIAQKLQNEGVACKHVDKVHEAERFLLRATTPEPRLVLIDDPLGPVELVADHRNELHRLRRLIADLPAHQRLIVTSNRAILSQAFGSLETEQWTIEGHAWQDVSRATAPLGEKLWSALLDGYDISPDTKDNIRERTGIADLNIGEIPRLAFTARQLIDDGFTEAEIIDRITRAKGSLGVSDYTDDPDAARLLVALALGSSSTTWCSEDTLAYLVHRHSENTGEIFPGRRTDRNEATSALTFPGSNQPEPPPPRYPQNYVLDESILSWLDLLIESNTIECNGSKWRFTHPAERAATLAAEISREVLLALYERALFCLSSDSAVCAVESIVDMWSSNLEDESLRALALAAPKLILAPVADRAIELLSLIYEQTDDPTKSKILHIVRSYLVERDNVIYRSGMIYFDTREDLPFGTRFDRKNKLARREVESRDLASADALRRANYIKSQLVGGHADFSLIWKIGLADPSPLVMLETIRGVCIHCFTSNRDPSPAFLSQIGDIAKRPSAAAVLEYHLAKFDEFVGATSEHDARLPWAIWATLTSQVLLSLPHDNRVVGGYISELYHYSRFAIERLSDTRLKTSLFESWLTWGEIAATYGNVDDYSLAAVAILFAITEHQPQLRRTLYPRLLTRDDTGVQGVYVADIIDEWEQLTTAERDLLLDLLRGTRHDVRWLRAFALTRASVPAPVVQAIMGSAVTDRCLDDFDDELLEACLYVYTGKGIFWAFGKHHSDRGEGFWMRSVEAIAANIEHRFFEIGIHQVIASHTRFAMQLSPVWSTLCEASTPRHRGKLWRVLIYKMCTINGDFRRYFNALAAATPDDEVEGVAIEIATNFEALDRLNHLESIAQDSRLVQILNRDHLVVDNLIMQLHQFHEENSSGLEFRAAILTIGRRSPPRTKVAHRILREMMSGTEDDFGSDRWDWYERGRSQVSKLEAQLEYSDRQKFADWRSFFDETRGDDGSEQKPSP